MKNNIIIILLNRMYCEKLVKDSMLVCLKDKGADDFKKLEKGKLKNQYSN